MIILCGGSASGKTTVAVAMVELGYKRVVTYTTRPMRKGEVDGVSYNFISDEEFAKMVKEGGFIEYATYRGWSYGTAVSSCTDDMDTVAVLTPAGLRNIRKAGIKVVSVYLQVDRVSRLIKLLERGDNPDESYRRNVSDEGMFAGFEDESDIVINNDNYKMDRQTVLQKVLDDVDEFLS